MNLFYIFGTSFLLSAFLIKIFLKYNLFQPHKDELKDIEKRNKLPTMGGIAIFSAVNLCFIQNISILLLANAFALLGFIDDFLKLKQKRQNGWNKWFRIFFEIIFAAIFVTYLIQLDSARNTIPIFSNLIGNFYLLNVFWGIFVIVASANAFNLTDGVDSLVSTLSIYALLFLIIQNTNNMFPVAIIFAILGFLFFNWPNAKIIMGDIGALGLGALVGGLFYQRNLELWLILVGIVFVFETISVILQIFYIRVLNSKLFLIAPFHHHLEKKGWSRTNILLIFNAIAIISLIFASFFI